MPKGIHTRVVQWEEAQTFVAAGLSRDQQEEAQTFVVCWAFRRLHVDCLPALRTS